MHKFPGGIRKLLPIVLLAGGCAITAHAQVSAVANAASLLSNTSLAPGSIVTIFGANLASSVAIAPSALNPPLSLGGASVSAGGAAAALFYVSPTQINAVLSPNTPAGAQTLRVTSASGAFSFTVNISSTAPPGLFSLFGTGTEDGAILNAVTFALGAFSVNTGEDHTFLAIFATGLDLSVTPAVLIGGVPVAVEFFGNAPCCMGLEQINVQLPESLEGAGRVEAVLQSGAQVSNAVEVVLLPRHGEGPFPGDQDNHTRSREVAAIAYIPGTSLALVADENDDVVRVIDIAQRKVTQVIALATGSEPVAIAVNASATLAAVAERRSGKVAIIDLTSFQVVGEVATGLGPVAVGIAGNDAVVVNGDADTVTIVDLAAKTALKTLPVGRGPRAVAVDPAALKAYVTNEDSGSISVIDLASLAVSNTIMLGANIRPSEIQLIAGSNLALVTVPSGGDDGEALLVNLSTGAFTRIAANPEHSGGSSGIAVNGSTVYLANQTGESVSVVTVSMVSGQMTAPPVTIHADLGVRALAIDTKDNLLLVLNEGSGNVVLVDLASGAVVGRVIAVRGGEGDSGNDDHSDHDGAAGLPIISSLSPATVQATSTFTITILGANLTGATKVNFINPAGIGSGDVASDEVQGDLAFVATNIQVSADGTQLTATVQVTAATPGPRVVSVVTPAGRSDLILSAVDMIMVVL